MNLQIAILAGDGIGPEVTHEAVTPSSKQSPNSAATTSPSPKPPSAASPSLLPAPPPAKSTDRHLPEFRRRPPRRSRRQQVQRTPPTSAPRPASSRSASTSAASPTSAPPSPTPHSPKARRSAPKSREGADILFVRELLGGLYFGEPRSWNRRNRPRRSHQHHALHRRRSHPRRPHRLRARRASAAKSSPRSTRPTSSNAPSSGAPPSTELAPEFPDVRRAPVRRRHGHAPHEPPAQLRRRPHRKPLRRHPLRRVRRHHRLPRHASLGHPRRQGQPLRTRPRLRPRHRGHRQGQPPRSHPHRRHAPPPLRLARSREAAPSKPPSRTVLEAGHRTADIARGNTAPTVTTQQMGQLVHEALTKPSTASNPCTPFNHTRLCALTANSPLHSPSP